MAFQTGSANDYVDLLNKLRDVATSNGVTVATVAAGGTGYVVGDVLTASGGTSTFAATFRVTAVSAGAVTTVKILTAGAYTVNPGNPVSTTGGTGTGCTLTLTFASNGWSINRESQEAVSATVSAGGTGYAVNDILTVSGGTFAAQAQFKVTAVSAGAVTTVALWSLGNYRTTPSNPAATTGGGGTGCTLTVTYRGVVRNANQMALSATVAAGGTGYVVGDVLTVSGGTSTTAAQLRVTTVSSGAVTAVAVHTRGDYTVLPTNPVSVTGGTGTGATFNVTWGAIQPNPDKELLLQGTGSGDDAIYVGFRTFNDAGGSGAHNWELAGMSGYTAASNFQDQPGISPGRWDESGTAREGAYVPLNNATLAFWFSVSPRKIAVVARAGSSSYSSGYVGWIDPFATEAEYPYPMAVMGTASVWNRLFSSSSISSSSVVDPIGATDPTNGPGFIRDQGGVWRTVQNSVESGGNRTSRGAIVVFPTGTIDIAAVDARDKGLNSIWDTEDIVPQDGIPGTVNVALHQTPDSPDFRTPLFPATIVGSSPTLTAYGELAGLFWLSTFGQVTNLVAEDTVEVSSDDYFVFQSANRSATHAHFALKRA